MEKLFESKWSFRKFQLVFATCATAVTCFFFVLFQTIYPIFDYNSIDLGHENIDLLQTQFEFQGDKHLYLYDVPYFMNKSIIIAGMVHNVQDHIEPLLQSLNEIYCIFNNTIFFIFESNSNDKTPQILKQWSLNNDKQFCDQYRLNRKRKKNMQWKFYKNKHPQSLITSIKNHYPALIEKIVIFNDTIVMDNLYKLQKLLNKPLNGSINLNRIERYTVYRNMMLEHIRSIQNRYMEAPWYIEFDYLMLIDLDLFALDARMLFNELYYSPTNILCANGVVYLYDMMYDIFAAVMDDGTWMHSLAFDAKRFKQKKTAKISMFPLNRYERMRSCFGGITIYKSLSKLLSLDCKYQIIPSTDRKMDNLDDDEYEYIMKAPNMELQDFADQYEIWMKSDARICEHLSYHYCLREHGYNISIAKQAKAYYSKKQVVNPMHRHNEKINKKLNKLPTLRNKAKGLKSIFV